jgi:radical SAM protein with 4Fe4S-binding SPASM domain
MSEEKFDFLLKNKVSICTSLDGPEKIHNRNRPWAKGNSYKATTDWIRKIQRFEKKKEKEGEKMYHLSALLTLSRFSLPYPKEIIDEYLKWGFDGIHIRPLSYLGASGVLKNTIGYSAEEFLDFWKKAMDYIISINLKGKLFSERGARIMLQKILTDQDTGFLDLRSPCGAAIGQVLYDYDGKIYTCDEGRMLKGDTFMIGDANKDNYQKIISNDKIKTMITASTLENLTCDYCAYKPYCGVCPVINYALYGNLFPQISNTDWCKTHRGMLDYLFDKIENKKIKEEVFDKWLEK